MVIIVLHVLALASTAASFAAQGETGQNGQRYVSSHREGPTHQMMKREQQDGFADVQKCFFDSLRKASDSLVDGQKQILVHRSFEVCGYHMDSPRPAFHDVLGMGLYI